MLAPRRLTPLDVNTYNKGRINAGGVKAGRWVIMPKKAWHGTRLASTQEVFVGTAKSRLNEGVVGHWPTQREAGQWIGAFLQRCNNERDSSRYRPRSSKELPSPMPSSKALIGVGELGTLMVSKRKAGKDAMQK